MKTLLISLICTCASISLFAQMDSTTNANNGTTNSTYTDTSGNMNNNNMNSAMNSTTDTSGHITIANPGTDSTGTAVMNSNTNNNWNDSMQNNTAMSSGNASLPVLETYVPENIIDHANQKYPNGQVYDITAVKSAEDTMTQKTTAMATTWDSTTNSTSEMDKDHDNHRDSSMAQNSIMNQNANNNYNNSNNMTAMETNSTAPVKYDYVVRVMQGGQMMSETLASNGTAMVVRNRLGKSEGISQ